MGLLRGVLRGAVNRLKWPIFSQSKLSPAKII